MVIKFIILKNFTDATNACQRLIADIEQGFLKVGLALEL